MRRAIYPVLILAAAAILLWLTRPEPEPDVVLYCGVDQDQSQQIAAKFSEETALKVRYEGEMESQRSIGLPQRLRTEAASPKADVYWSNEIMYMVNLGQSGMLAPLPEGVADAFPEMWRDPNGRYIAFGARARVLLVNTELLGDEKDHPTRVADLLDPKYHAMGLLTCMARPLTGTTKTHAVALLTKDVEGAKQFLEDVVKANKEGRLKLTVSNGGAMRETSDSKSKIAFCLTDTDDAYKAIQSGAPVKVVYPDQADGELGTVLIPNTVAIVKGAKHAEAAEKLLRWLVTTDNEMRLARGPSAQIPLNPSLADADLPAHVKRPEVDFRPANVDWQKVGEDKDRWDEYLAATFRN
jgi:iron(III) transport system substrate-binding protein